MKLYGLTLLDYFCAVFPIERIFVLSQCPNPFSEILSTKKPYNYE